MGKIRDKIRELASQLANDPRLTRAQRAKYNERKAAHLRRIADRKWGLTDLLSIFALGLRARALDWRGTAISGKRMRNRCCHNHHPAGTKFLRRCIRQSGRESTANRLAYAALTGHQYNGA